MRQHIYTDGLLNLVKKHQRKAMDAKRLNYVYHRHLVESTATIEIIHQENMALLRENIELNKPLHKLFRWSIRNWASSSWFMSEPMETGK